MTERFGARSGGTGLGAGLSGGPPGHSGDAPNCHTEHQSGESAEMVWLSAGRSDARSGGRRKSCRKHKWHTTFNHDSNNLSLPTLRIHGCQGTSTRPSKDETLNNLSLDKMDLTLDTP
jgi:hypothetical protein